MHVAATREFIMCAAESFGNHVAKTGRSLWMSDQAQGLRCLLQRLGTHHAGLRAFWESYIAKYGRVCDSLSGTGGLMHVQKI